MILYVKKTPDLTELVHKLFVVIIVSEIPIDNNRAVKLNNKFNYSFLRCEVYFKKFYLTHVIHYLHIHGTWFKSQQIA